MRSTPTPPEILRTVKVSRAPPAAAGDHDAGEHLDALFFALADLHVDADAVARSELRDVALERGFFDFEQKISHDKALPIPNRLQRYGNGEF